MLYFQLYWVYLEWVILCIPVNLPEMDCSDVLKNENTASRLATPRRAIFTDAISFSDLVDE
jgi:hypothetical protein